MLVPFKRLNKDKPDTLVWFRYIDIRALWFGEYGGRACAYLRVCNHDLPIPVHAAEDPKSDSEGFCFEFVDWLESYSTPTLREVYEDGAE